MQQRLRINFILPPVDLSGGNRVVAIHAAALQARGHRVTVISPPHAPPRLRHRVKSLLTGRGWPRGHAPRPSHFGAAPFEHRVLETHRPVRDADVPDADVVVATWWETAEWVAALSPNKGAKLYFIQHDERVVCPAQADRVAATWRLPMRKIVVASWLAKLAADEFGDDTAIVASNGVSHEQFHAPPRGKHAPARIGFIYSPAPFKAVEVMIEACHHARRDEPSLQLTAFGARPPQPNLPLPPDCDYHVNPPQDRLRERYAACDAWLVCSRCEGFGLPTLEAMACRTPVIATPTGAAPDLLADGGGRLVPVDDVQAIAQAILELARMSDRDWRAWSDAAWATASKHGWDQATHRFEQALFDAIATSSRTSAATATCSSAASSPDLASRELHA